ncbi:MAG TPA: hypothetical protein VK581_10645, partial [Chthoniobacterales bacterium]|nr:hypothetical protein [Chthoniobacterales bacterium]
MSNYLTRLIERSVGAPPQIEPLIAPLYAPSEQILSGEPGTIAPSPAKIESSDRSTAPGNPANSKTSEAASSKIESQRFRDSPLPSASPAGFPIDASVGPPDPDESRQASSPPAPAALDPASVPLSPPILAQESTRIVAPPKNAELSKPAEATEGPLQLSESQNRISVQPEIIGRRKPSTPSVPASQPPSNEPPAIHVTIGRVEVRAVMSPSAPPKVPARVAPRPSLGE